MKFEFSDKTYARLNTTVKLILPALGTFYFTMASIWGLPYGEQVVGSLAALTVLLGVIMTLAKRVWSKHADGELIVDQNDPNKDLYSLELGIPLEDLSGKKQLTLNVNNVNPPVA